MERRRQRIPVSLDGFVVASIVLLAAIAIQPSNCEQTSTQSTSSQEVPPQTSPESSTTTADLSSNQTMSELQELTDVLSTYVNEALDRNFKEIIGGLTTKVVALSPTNVSITADARGLDALGLSEFDRKILRGLARLIDRRLLAGNTMARAVQTGRLFFFKGESGIKWGEVEILFYDFCSPHLIEKRL